MELESSTASDCWVLSTCSSVACSTGSSTGGWLGSSVGTALGSSAGCSTGASVVCSAGTSAPAGVGSPVSCAAAGLDSADNPDTIIMMTVSYTHLTLPTIYS